MKFWNTSWFHAVLHIVGIVGTAILPIAAASGVGIPAVIVAVGAGVGGGALKLAQSPITPQSIADAVDTAVSKK